jgi:hypothetical protein
VRVSPSGHLRLQRFASQGTGVSSRPSPPRWPRVSYAINRTSIPPRASKLTSKPGAVIVIGVDRHGVGRDNSARRRLRTLGGCSQEVFDP